MAQPVGIAPVAGAAGKSGVERPGDRPRQVRAATPARVDGRTIMAGMIGRQQRGQ